MNELERCRKQIDAIDEQLLKLLNQRAEWAVRAGRWKKTYHQSVWQPEREAQILQHVENSNPGPLDDAAIRRLFERIIDEARSLERHIVSESGPRAKPAEGQTGQEKE
ncbi:MAG TPA: chorismate mutase [Terriglobia bacterium]|nr:chorismate mutase [Terriglobia bacterium]